MVETTLNEYFTGNLHTVVAIDSNFKYLYWLWWEKNVSTKEVISIPSSISKTLPSESLFFISRHL